MKRVAEIIHIVEGEREAFLEGCLHPDNETQKVLWTCGVRKQQYFSLGELLFMTFEYKGEDFSEDMKKMAAYLDSKGLLVQKRRKDVPKELRETTNWWAPVKKLGACLETEPEGLRNTSTVDFFCYEGHMLSGSVHNDIAYDEDDWSESMHM